MFSHLNRKSSSNLQEQIGSVFFKKIGLKPKQNFKNISANMGQNCHVYWFTVQIVWLYTIAWFPSHCMLCHTKVIVLQPVAGHCTIDWTFLYIIQSFCSFSADAPVSLSPCLFLSAAVPVQVWNGYGRPTWRLVTCSCEASSCGRPAAAELTWRTCPRPRRATFQTKPLPKKERKRMMKKTALCWPR